MSTKISIICSSGAGYTIMDKKSPDELRASMLKSIVNENTKIIQMGDISILTSKIEAIMFQEVKEDEMIKNIIEDPPKEKSIKKKRVGRND